jgi:hypothetical protein
MQTKTRRRSTIRIQQQTRPRSHPKRLLNLGASCRVFLTSGEAAPASKQTHPKTKRRPVMELIPRSSRTTSSVIAKRPIKKASRSNIPVSKSIHARSVLINKSVHSARSCSLPVLLSDANLRLNSNRRARGSQDQTPPSAAGAHVDGTCDYELLSSSQLSLLGISLSHSSPDFPIHCHLIQGASFSFTTGTCPGFTRTKK